MSRDDFSEPTKRTLAQRAGGQCSNPGCRAQLFGPQSDPAKALNLGVAAHISAASPGGPRYDPLLSSAERSEAENGIWLCNNCGKLVDNDPAAFPTQRLRDWKEKAEADALRTIGRPAAHLPTPVDIPTKWVGLEYIEEAGIAASLRAAGYRLYWARAENIAGLVDLKGWDEVVWDDPKRGRVYLRVKDPFCEYVGLLRKPASSDTR